MVWSAASFPWLALSLYVIVFLPGLLLVIAGVRGKRVDDHPVCRGCGFDLFGTVEPIPDKHPKCPECGTRREPKVGNRVRRRKLALAGWLLVLLSLGSLGFWGYERLGAEQLAGYKPVWLLRWEAGWGASNTAWVALAELSERWAEGKLTIAEGELLFDDAVAHGPASNAALMNTPVGERWGELAADLMLSGMGSAAEREALGRAWINIDPRVRPRVRRGEPIPFEVHRQHFRQPSALRFEFGPPVLRIDGRAVDSVLLGNPMFLRMLLFGGHAGSVNESRIVDPQLLAGLDVGGHQLTIELPVSLMGGGYSPVAVASWVERWTRDFEVVPPDETLIAMIRDPARAAQVEGGVMVRDRILRTDGGRVGVTTLDWPSLPVGIAYRVSLRREDSMWPFGVVSSAATAKGLDYAVQGEVPEELEDGAVVDLVFEPSAAVARGTVELTEVLDHGFVIEGVRIVRPGARP